MGHRDAAFADLLDGKRVALVGPAPSVVGSGNGEAIEAHDLVIRINRGHPVPSTLMADIGRRTDVLYHNCWFGNRPLGDLQRAAASIGPEVRWVCSVYPRIDLDHPHTADVDAFRGALDGRTAFRTVPLDRYLALWRRLLTRPNAGISAIHDLLGFEVASLFVAGFTLYTGERLYHPGYDGEGLSPVHDQGRQRAWLRDVLAADPRLVVDVALDDGDAAVLKLDAGCCDPGRSPRMAALAQTLAAARRELDQMADDDAAAESALAHLEDAGAQVGGLQVGCCTPKRMPLYARILEDLTAAQLAINQALNRGH